MGARIELQREYLPSEAAYCKLANFMSLAKINGMPNDSKVGVVTKVTDTELLDLPKTVTKL